MAKFLTRIFGSRNQRLLRQYSKVVNKINAMEESLQALSDGELRAKTDEFRQRYTDGETLEQLLPEVQASERKLEELDKEMHEAAEVLDFERAAGIRDRIQELKQGRVQGVG